MIVVSNIDWWLIVVSILECNAEEAFPPTIDENEVGDDEDEVDIVAAEEGDEDGDDLCVETDSESD